MSDATKIEWTDRTWNPVRGCTRVSEGCRNCYAERTAVRHAGPGRPYEDLAKSTPGGPRWTGVAKLFPHKLAEPLGWREPSKVFVNSMSDLFHESLAFEEIAAVFGVMAAAQRHTFQVLTKRPARALEWFEWIADQGEELEAAVGDKPEGVGAAASACAIFAEQTAGPNLLEAYSQPWPLPNVWLGVSVEDQATAEERIPLLLECPAALRFVSYEPALGPVDFEALIVQRGGVVGQLNALGCSWWPAIGDADEEERRREEVEAIDWVIVGGDSARECDLGWIRLAVEQCAGVGIPAFVKQLGARPVTRPHAIPGGLARPHWSNVPGRPLDLRHPKGGDPEEWPEDLQVRQFPEVAA
ncbi:MAG: DUF5131 family protein [Acidobacteriota bacterium]